MVTTGDAKNHQKIGASAVDRRSTAIEPVTATIEETAIREIARDRTMAWQIRKIITASTEGRIREIENQRSRVTRVIGLDPKIGKGTRSADPAIARNPARLAIGGRSRRENQGTTIGRGKNEEAPIDDG